MPGVGVGAVGSLRSSGERGDCAGWPAAGALVASVGVGAGVPGVSGGAGIGPEGVAEVEGGATGKIAGVTTVVASFLDFFFVFGVVPVTPFVGETIVVADVPGFTPCVLVVALAGSFARPLGAIGATGMARGGGELGCRSIPGNCILRSPMTLTNLMMPRAIASARLWR